MKINSGLNIEIQQNQKNISQRAHLKRVAKISCSSHYYMFLGRSHTCMRCIQFIFRVINGCNQSDRVDIL